MMRPILIAALLLLCLCAVASAEEPTLLVPWWEVGDGFTATTLVAVRNASDVPALARVEFFDTTGGELLTETIPIPANGVWTANLRDIFGDTAETSLVPFAHGEEIAAGWATVCRLEGDHFASPCDGIGDLSGDLIWQLSPPLRLAHGMALPATPPACNEWLVRYFASEDGIFGSGFLVWGDGEATIRARDEDGVLDPDFGLIRTLGPLGRWVWATDQELASPWGQFEIACPDGCGVLFVGFQVGQHSLALPAECVD